MWLITGKPALPTADSRGGDPGVTGRRGNGYPVQGQVWNHHGRPPDLWGTPRPSLGMSMHVCMYAYK